jgi:hypothetical protein
MSLPRRIGPYHWDIVEARYDHLLQAWDAEQKLVQKHIGAKAPREKAGLIFEKMKQ